MTSTSALSEIARHQGDLEQSLALAEVAHSESIRLDEAMQISDTTHHRFDKLVKYAVALCNVGRLDEASVFVEEAQELARQLRELDWPDALSNDQRVDGLRDLIRELQD